MANQIEKPAAEKRPAEPSKPEIPAKVAATETPPQVQVPVVSGSDTDITMSDLPGTGKPQGENGSPGVDEYYLPTKRTNFGSRTSTYSKTFSFVSECFVSTILNLNNVLYCTSEMLEIPWHLPTMYMTPSEFELLQPGAHCKRVSIQIKFRGATVKFETNSSSTQVATLNTIQNLKTAVGLNKTGWGGQFYYSALNATDSMIPTAVVDSVYDNSSGRLQTLTQELYGRSTRLGVPGGYNSGNFIIGRNYWCETSPVDTFQYGWNTARSQKINTYDGKTMVNKEIVNETYYPKMGCLKAPLRYYRNALPQIGTGLAVNVGGAMAEGRLATLSSASGTTTVSETQQDMTTNGPTYTDMTTIEKSQQLKQGPWGIGHPDIQPSINVGVQAIPQLGSLNYITGVYSNLVQASAYFDVFTEMEVVEHNPTHFNYANVANVPLGDEIYTFGTAPDYNTSRATLGGLMTNSV